MYNKTKILLKIVSAIVFLGCTKSDDFDVVPVLELEEYTIFNSFENEADSALFKFFFKDGDGDLGSRDSNEINCFLMYEEKNGDSSVSFSGIPPREYSLPNVTPDALNRNIEGSIVLILKPAPIFNFFTDSAYRYTCYLVDRAGNSSNVISSSWNLKN